MADNINLDDPNADLFGRNDPEESEEEQAYKQLYGKNPNRVSALNDLWYQEMIKTVDDTDLPEEAKRQMIFKMTANGILDMVADCAPVEMALDLSFYFDMYMGVSLTNKMYNVDLFKEQQKALLSIDRSQFPDEESYEREIVDFEEQWWDIPQPRLEKRNPNEAIREKLSKYGLTDQ